MRTPKKSVIFFFLFILASAQIASAITVTSTAVTSVNEDDGYSYTIVDDSGGDAVWAVTSGETLPSWLTLQERAETSIAKTINSTLVLTNVGDVTDYNVDIAENYYYVDSSTHDTLSYTGTLPTGVTANFDTAKGTLTFTGTTITANWQALLRTVQITLHVNDASSVRKVNFTEGKVPGIKDANGVMHYYELVNHGLDISWTAAKDAAAAKSYNGREGYLATSTSSTENDFITKKISQVTWLGASDAETNNTWKWITGPEAGTHFFTQKNDITNPYEAGYCVGGGEAETDVNGNPYYINWADYCSRNNPTWQDWNEPNGTFTAADGDSSEHYLHMLSSTDPLGAGFWNDYANTQTVSNYLVEYGGMSNDDVTNTFSQGFFVSTNYTLSGTPTNTDVGTHNVKLTGNNPSDSSTTTHDFTITVSNLNDPPSITSTAGTTATEDIEYTYNPTATDVDSGDTDDSGSSLTWSLSGQPTGMSVNVNTGDISWTPGNGIDTSGEVTLSVADGGENGATPGIEKFTVTVTAVDDAPTVSNGISNVSVSEDAGDSTIDLSTVFTDVDNDDGSITKAVESNSNTGLVSATISGDTLTLDYVADANGTATISIRATSNGKTVDNSFTVTVSAVNDAPTVANPISDVSVNEDAANTTIDISNVFADADSGDYISKSVKNNTNSGLVRAAINGDTLTLDYTANASGSATLQIRGNSNGQMVDDYFDVTVTAVNDSPVITSTAGTTATEDIEYTYNPTATDVDSGDTDDSGSSLTWSLSGQPTGMSVNVNTGDISWTPGNGMDTSGEVTLSLADGGENASVAATEKFTVTVTAVDDAPTVNAAINDVSVSEDAVDTTIDLSSVFTDVDNDNNLITKTVESNSNMGLLSATISSGNTLTLDYIANANGTADITIRATSNGKTVDDSFTVTVSSANDAPIVANPVSDVTVNEDAVNTTISLSTLFTDSDNDDSAITKSVQANTNSSLVSTSITGDTLTLSYAVDGNGSADITIRGSSGGDTVDDTFTVTVSAANDAPVFTSSQVTAVDEDALYSYTIATIDVDGDGVSILATNTPDWLSLTDNGNGTASLSGTPDNADVGAHTVSLKVSDGTLFSYQNFTVNVSNTNDAPTVSSDAVTVATEDSLYHYTLIGDDIDTGDSVTYSAVTLPSSWLSFDSGTGVLSGTPLNTDVGNHSIVLRVADAGGLSADQNFTITVHNTNDTLLIDSTATTDATENVAYSYTLTSHDVDAADTLTSSVITKPAWLSFVPISNVNSNKITIDSGVLSGTPGSTDVGDHTIVLQITDGITPVHQTFTITVANVNDAPVISGTPNTRVDEDALYEFVPTVVDPDQGDTQSFTISGKPDWASFSTTTGKLSGTPANDNVGTYSNIEITVTDGSAAADTLAAFSITVGNTNDAPAITSTATTSADEGNLYSYTIVASDIDVGDSLTYSAPGRPSWLTFNSTTHLLSGTPAQTDLGTHTVTLRVNDGSVNVDQVFEVSVSSVNNAPAITSTAPITATEDVLYSYTAAVTDIDDANNGTDLIWSLSGEPSGMLVYPTGTVIWTPTEGVTTSGEVTLSVADGGEDGAAAATQSFTIAVTAVNDPPTVLNGLADLVVNEDADDTIINVSILFTDIDNADPAISKSVQNNTNPSLLTASIADNTLTLSYAADGSGSADITIRGSSDGDTVDDTFTVTVSAANDAPVFTSAQITAATEDTLYSYSVVAADADDDGLSISATNIPAWLSLTDTGNGTTATLSGTPANGDIGDHTVILKVSDGDLFSYQNFTVSVSNTNDAPTISSDAVTMATEDSPYSYTLIGDDIDTGDSLTYSAVTDLSSSWLSFNPGTGILSGTPGNGDVGDHSIVLRVTDAGGLSVDQSFIITVHNTNDTLLIDSTAITGATEDVAYNYILRSHDVDVDDNLTSSVITKPDWLIFTPITAVNSNNATIDSGVLSGTPGNADVGEHNIVLQVTDGTTPVYQTFTITVANVNDAPEISGLPNMGVDEDALYEFIPTVIDGDKGDTKSFTISGKPDWANFSSVTGALAGIPTNDNVGTYSNIVITVTDGSAATDSLDTFSITVANTNDAPIITSIAFTSAKEDSLYSYTVAASDVDLADSLTYSAVSIPSWLSFNAGTHVLAGTPAGSDVGSHTVNLRVNDGSVNVDQTFEITVASANTAPSITSTAPSSATENVLYTYTPTVTDNEDSNNGTDLTWSLSDEPSGMLVSPTGTVTWTPAKGTTTSGLVTLRVEDRGALFDTEKFSIAVSEMALPVLTTDDVTNIQSTSAVISGNITDEGGSSVVQRGVCWAIFSLPTTDDDCMYETLTAGGLGEFTVPISHLQSRTEYFVRSYAANSAGTAYGNEIAFKTKSSLLLIMVPIISGNSQIQR